MKLVSVVRDRPMRSRGREPLGEERADVPRRGSTARAAQRGLLLGCADLLASTVVVGIGPRSERLEELLARAEPRGGEALDEVGAEVLGDRSGRACRAEGVAELRLGGAEVALDVVRVGRDEGVVEAGEEVGPVARGQGGDLVDEGRRGSAESEARRFPLELLEERVQAGLGLRRVGGRIASVRTGGDLVRDLVKDLDVSGDAPRGAVSVPVASQRLFELVEVRVWAPPFAAAA